MKRAMALLVTVLALDGMASARGLLEITREPVHQSRFCRTFGCVFLERGGGHTNGTDFDQYLYRLDNGLFFFASRFTPNEHPGKLEPVRSVSIAAYATPSGLRKLRAFLPELVGWAVLGRRVAFPFDFERKCLQDNDYVLKDRLDEPRLTNFVGVFSRRTNRFEPFSQPSDRFQRYNAPASDPERVPIRVACARSGVKPGLLTVTTYPANLNDPMDFIDFMFYFRGGSGRLPTPY